MTDSFQREHRSLWQGVLGFNVLTAIVLGIVGFFVVNIIVATMFLRWHWLVDVLVGLGLAILSQVLSVKVTDHELSRRARERLMPTWPEFARKA